MELIFGIMAVAVFMAYFTAHKKKKRRAALMLKYGDAEIVDAIIAHKFWQGQTGEQLMDSLGRPADIDEKVLKTKTKQTWKYHPTAKNRYALRITVENGSVVGWERK